MTLKKQHKIISKCNIKTKQEKKKKFILYVVRGKWSYAWVKVDKIVKVTIGKFESTFRHILFYCHNFNPTYIYLYNSVLKAFFLYSLDCSVGIPGGTALPDGLSACDNVLAVYLVQNQALLNATLQRWLHAAHLEPLTQLCLLPFGWGLSRIVKFLVHFTLHFTALICTNKQPWN